MKKDDHIRFHGETSPGTQLVERRRGNTIQWGKVSVAEDGKPIQEGGELVYTDLPDQDGWHPTTVIYRSGPPQVATPAYREGYDRIFGGKRKVAEA